MSAASETIAAPDSPVGSRLGYYLVRDSDQARFYVGNRVCMARLNKVCSRHLSERTGWGYWVDRSLGLDIDGRVAWVNLDHTDLFL